MSRRARNQTNVSLFPFLAVLLCAMGALLVLLVITTRQIRDEAIRQATADKVENPEPAPVERDPKPAYQWPEWEIALGPAEALERKRLPTPPPPALRAPKPVFVTRETDPPPPDLTKDLQRFRQQIQGSSLQLAERRQSTEEIQTRRVGLLAEIEKRENVLQNGEQAIADFRSQRMQLSREVGALEQKSAVIGRELQQLEQTTAALAKRPRNSTNVLKVVPYDGQQGTTRRPILIECAGDTLRFLPEGIELSERDLVGFSLKENPLLAGVLAAEAYWMKRDRAVANINRPYVLLIVRPDGIPAYYAARQLLQNYREASGYELLTADQKLALPEVEPQVQQQIARAIQDQLQKRGGTPSLARTPFPQVDPNALKRLRNGDDSLKKRAGNRNNPAGSQNPTPEKPAGKRFKYVQTSQGLKMVPIDEPTRKRFDTPPGSSRDRAASETRSARTENGNPLSNRKFSEPSPLPSPPEGSKVKTLTTDQSNDSHWSNLDSGSRSPASNSASSRPETPRDPTHVPDAWTPLLEARQRNRSENSGTSSGSNDRALSKPTSNQSDTQQGLSSPFGDPGSLAFRRTIEIRISDTHLRVANRDALTIPEGISTTQLMSATVLELRREVQSWKAPPEQFHWKPTVKFVIYPGGNQYLERLRPAFEEQELLSGVKYGFSAPAPNWRPTQP